VSIPIAAYPAPFNTTRASHVVLSVKDLGRSASFYIDALGLVESAREKDALYLRGVEEACHHSLVLRQTSTDPAAQRVGFRAFSEQDLEQAAVFFRSKGLHCEWVEVPHQGRTFHVTDSVGTPLEYCSSMETKERLVVKFEQFRSGAPQRLDHFQLLTPEVQEATAFYTAMGFRVSEYVAIDNTDDIVFVFLQRKGNPHDIVFAHGAGPRLHHVAYCVADASALIRLCDVAGNVGFGGALEHGPGRHGPGHALFVYLRDPDGHRIEFFTTHYQVMDIENVPVRWNVSYLKKRPWGLPPRQQWYQEAMPFEKTEVRHPSHPPKPATLESMLLASLDRSDEL
jgi:catechol 2,3-dioxygenase